MANTGDAMKEAKKCIKKKIDPTDPQVAVCVRRLKEEQKIKDKAKRMGGTVAVTTGDKK